ncbi:tetratricopeptide repeat protein [Bradyrhizobium sp. WYCCWR 13022]|uniref:tetratricopeptide repeat protein n=1 Tax=unclassified Bradyrhizobium TaxID=2631580 RepID=UPI00263B2822|nr:tetratricopeptide repeat protein [Bradyrhizobium sp. WYCCWR 13022]MDN4988094.1 tetratricopeptide repeat protein [Bradyrhizobium sp. WYCCWR 13022]
MDDTQTLVRRAAAAVNSGKPDEAQRLCEQGLARDPGDPVLHHLLAAVLFSRGVIVPARAHIDVSLAKRPNNAPARLLAARIERTEGQFDAALVHLDAAIAISPQREMFVEKARTLDMAGLRDQARGAWQAILKVIPGHQEATAQLGRMAWEDGDPATAASLLAQATATDAPASVWFNLGLARQDLRDHDGAADAYRKAFALKPDHAEAALNLGISLQEVGDMDAAMDAFGKAYRLRPQLFGSIAMALTSASHGRLWLDEDALRRALSG